MSNTHTFRTNGHANGHTYPELVISSKMDEQDESYYAALKLVARIDDDLAKGTRHYRTKAGVLLTTLDEVVRAILSDDLMTNEEAKAKGPIWIPPQELAA